MEDRTLLATMLWANSAGGDWDTASNWVNSANSSDHHVPTSSDNAEINVSGITVTHTSSTSDAVSSVTVASGTTLSLTNGTLSLTSGLTLNGATVELGNAAGSTYGQLYFNGTQTLAGTGTVLYGKSSSNALDETASSSSTLTLGSGITVRGSSGTLGGYYSNDAVVNQGTIAADDSGGLTPPFVYDTDFSGGFTGSTAAVISTSGVTDPAPEAVYQTYRAGSFSYTLTGLSASASYTLRLHLADPTSTAVGQRQFNVSVNGTTALTNFDIFATAGGADQAVVESVPVTATAQGQVTIGFADGAVGTPLVSGIELDSGGSIVQAIDCGELAGGTITVNPATFTNQGTLQAQNDATLTLSGTWSNQGTLTATNSTVNLGGSFTVAALGSFQRSGSTVNLTGTLSNTGTTLALTAATGSWNLLGGTINGGTVSEAGGAELAFTTSGGTLAGVSFDNNLDLASVNDANATVTGGLTLNGATMELGNAAGSTYGQLYFNGTQTLAGTGTVLFGKSSSNALDETASSSSTLTLGSGITVRGSSGTLGGYYSNDAVVNQGTIAADDSGGLTPPFVYDTDFSGGFTGSTAAVISTSGVTDPAPEAVYQTYRAGSFSYTLTGLSPSASYTLRLHLADPTSTAAGQRQFNVSVNGTTALTNFDIFATAGGEDKAVVESLPVTATAQGQVTISFADGAAGTPLVNGIELDSGGSIVQAIDCGELAGGTITVNPATFTNQGTLQATNGDILSFAGAAWTSQGSMEADSGSVIKIGSPATFSPTSQVMVDVNGTTPGAFGLISVSGSAALNGTLNVLAGTGVTLNAGNAIQVMTFTSATENFVNVTGTGSGRYVFFVETLSDTAVTLTTATTSEDLAASSITIAPTGTAGQDVNVTYTVDNLSDIPVSGDWFDSIYLTQGTTLDATAVLLTRVERTTTVAADGSYTVALNVPLPGLVPGGYHPILFVDSRGLQPDADRSNNLLVSSGTIQVSMPSMNLGDSVSTTIASGQSLYYSVAIPAGHDVAFTVAANMPGAAELYVRYAVPPSPTDYGQFAFSSTNPDEEIDITGATQGTYYILVQGEPPAGNGRSLTLSVHDEPFSVRGVSVTHANTGAPSRPP